MTDKNKKTGYLGTLENEEGHSGEFSGFSHYHSYIPDRVLQKLWTQKYQQAQKKKSFKKILP